MLPPKNKRPGLRIEHKAAVIYLLYIKELLRRAIADEERGVGGYNMDVAEEAMDFWADVANGDARQALNALELAALTTAADPDGKIRIALATAEQCIQKRALNYDKNGDSHYDTISAFIKSMRGSDPDAALYYLGRMIYAGEDPKFIARRMVIAASEDVGNADPHALQVAVAAATATDFIGLPECQIILAQAVTYIACAPKSNASYVGINRALKDVSEQKVEPVPIHLRDTSYRGAKNLGHGKGYKYPHDYPNNWVEQNYLPDGTKSQTYYEPTSNGREAKIRERLKDIRKD